VLHLRGRDGEARDALAAALDAYDAKGATVATERVQALLAEL
jgi:predicted RNase H-like nuclease (RuvC/YqgF family)